MAIIGAHVSSAGGLENVIKRGTELGAGCIQFFLSSPRSWFASYPSPHDIQKFLKAKSDSGIKKVFVHGSYLINLGSSSRDLYNKSVRNLTDQLKICNEIKAEGLIFHLGSRKDGNTDADLLVVDALRKILDEARGGTKLILENAAGSGAKIGSSIAELGLILKKIGGQRLAVCYDTAHGFESGIIKNYSSPNIKLIGGEIKEKVGWDNIAAIHLNDSKSVWNSHYDRHENIGDGFIGLEGFKNLAMDKNFSGIPWILEVPGVNDSGPDLRNMKVVNDLFL